MKCIVVIPARMESSRFPGKPLAPLRGKPLIRHVYENSHGASMVSDVLVATDSEEIRLAVEGFGGKAVMTSAEHASGTDRCAEASAGLDCDIIVNVQGDEPLVRPRMIDQVIEALGDERASVSTLAKRLEGLSEADDPNTVKVVFDAENFALYFSRSPIPYHRDGRDDLRMFKHVGIYGYRRDALIMLSNLPPTNLEGIEKLEQLRALENGMKIKVGLTEYDTIGVDTPKDLERVERWLNSYS